MLITFRVKLRYYGKIRTKEVTMAEKEGWQSRESVKRYQKTADVVIPYRRTILSLITRLSAAFTPDRPRILDLGCGPGDVTAEILALKPQASVVMIDNSEEMLKIARERFQSNKNIEIITYDMDSGLPKHLLSKKFHAVVSCFAIHHVEYANRVKLYTDIRRSLVAGGLFVNGDRFTGESPRISNWEGDDWINWMVASIKEKLATERTFDELKNTQLESDKKHGDKPGTIWSMRDDLKLVGFKYVDCVWKAYNLGVLTATNLGTEDPTKTVTKQLYDSRTRAKVN